MINFVIAILADTYTKLSNSSLGLYYDGVISRIPVYEDDSRYGGLIVGTPPFNILALLMIPFYILVKNEERLVKVNDVFTKAMFFPIALSFTAMIIAVNLLLLPLAYFAAIWKKITLIRIKVKSEKVFDLVTFVFLGVPLLLLVQIRDALHAPFIFYRTDVKELTSAAQLEEYLISEEQFEMIEAFVAIKLKGT